MRRLPGLPAWLILVAAFGGWAVPLRAQHVATIPREHHAWGRFPPGSWKLVRVTTETFDPQGRSTGVTITETRTTLKEVRPDRFALLIESTVEVAGRRIVTQPRQVTQHYNGAIPGQVAEIRSLGSDTVNVDETPYVCRVHEFEVTAGNHKTLTKTYYSPAVKPYVLRRETTVLDTDNGTISGRTTVRVISLNAPQEILDQQRMTSLLRVDQKYARSTETTFAVNCADVPGGVVSHRSTELDSNGRMKSSSTMELVDYGIARPPRETRRFHLFPSRRWRNVFRNNGSWRDSTDPCQYASHP